MRSSQFEKYLAEAFGTFCMVFAGTGAIIVNEVTSGTVTHVGVSLVFGLVVLAMIYSIGHISGAHLNPAVTLGFLSIGRLTWREAVNYILAQAMGALLASLALKVIFSDQFSSLGVTTPSGSAMQSLLFVIIRDKVKTNARSIIC